MTAFLDDRLRSIERRLLALEQKNTAAVSGLGAPKRAAFGTSGRTGGKGDVGGSVGPACEPPTTSMPEADTESRAAPVGTDDLHGVETAEEPRDPVRTGSDPVPLPGSTPLPHGEAGDTKFIGMVPREAALQAAREAYGWGVAKGSEETGDGPYPTPGDGDYDGMLDNAVRETTSECAEAKERKP